MRFRIILYISGLLAVLSACSGFEKVVKGTDYILKYEKAKELYAEEEYYKASVLFDQIASVYRGTDKADTVYFFQAMSYFKQADYIMAGHYFDNFARVYGASDFLEQADFMTAYCFYKVSPRPELDQNYSEVAIQNFQKFIIKHPDSDRKQEAIDYSNELRDKLVEKSFISARLYYDLEDYKASMVALSNSLIDFPESKYREDLMFMSFKSSYKYAENSVFIKKKERYQASLDEYYSFIAEYPESKYVREAKRYYTAAMKYLGNKKYEETEIN